MKQDLSIIRSQTDVNAYKVGKQEEDLSLSIKNIVWQVPFIKPSDGIRLQMLRLLKNESLLTVPFRTWGLYTYPSLPSNTKDLTWPIKTSTSLERPRFFIVGFQTKRLDNKLVDSSSFDHCNVRNVSAYLGSERYPYIAHNVDFVKNRYSPLYEELVSFRRRYYNYSTDEPMFNDSQFKSTYPLWVIDTRYQTEVASSSNIDIKLEIESNEPFPIGTTCHCLIIADRIVEISPFSGVVKHIV